MNHSGTFFTSRPPDEVFDLLANPELFAPLLPDYESMVMQDPTHFSLRIVIALGEMRGHATLAMERVDAERPALVSYRGQGVVAGSQLNLALEFRISHAEASTQVNWAGEFSLDGGLAFVMGSLLEPMGHQQFERMGERLREGLNPAVSADALPPPEAE